MTEAALKRREPTEGEKLVGRYVRSQFGPETSVRRYADDNDENDLFLVAGPNHPIDGVTSFGTAGLFLHPMSLETGSVAVELLGACATATPHFDNVIASCAIERLKNNTQIIFGSVIRDVVTQYGISPTMKHMFFVTPFLWDGFTPQTIAGVEVHWLMAVPIAESELAYLNQYGPEALEARFERDQIDVFDIGRSSVA